MSQTSLPALQQAIRDYVAKNGSKSLEIKTGIYWNGIKKIADGDMTHKFRRSIIDQLYDFFDLEIDDWYKENLKKWFRPTDSAIGDIFRLKRLSKGIALEQIEKDLHISKRQLMRIEAGHSLPSYKGYAINKLCQYYEFTPEEVEKIRWAVCILQDVLKIRNALAGKYDIEKEEDEE